MRPGSRVRREHEATVDADAHVHKPVGLDTASDIERLRRDVQRVSATEAAQRVVKGGRVVPGRLRLIGHAAEGSDEIANLWPLDRRLHRMVADRVVLTHVGRRSHAVRPTEGHARAVLVADLWEGASHPASP